VILASVGTQLPFDRLIKAVDDWAFERCRKDVTAQIGPSRYVPRAIEHFAFMEHDRFFDLQSRCTVMVSHAGMGSIITALELGKPIIILARDHERHEHRNGHQLDTLRQFAKYPGIYAARDEAEVAALLDKSDTLTATPTIGGSAPRDFVEKLADYVQQGEAGRRRTLFGFLKRKTGA
jgi:UDP-N-acetylglucosamine transferase subunit ALG13